SYRPHRDRPPFPTRRSSDLSNLPPEISPADEAAVKQAVEAALAAFDAADTLDELKAARLAHTGDNAPLTLANRLIGKLEKSEKRSEEHTSELQSRFDLVCRL